MMGYQEIYKENWIKKNALNKKNMPENLHLKVAEENWTLRENSLTLMHENENIVSVSMHKIWSFLLWISSINVTNPQKTADLVTFTEEILLENFIFCKVSISKKPAKFEMTFQWR